MDPDKSIRESTLVVIPAQDESATVGAIVRRVRRLGFEVLVVDDASADDTARVSREAGARVISLPFSLGAWLAMQTGIRYALTRDFRWVVTLDADGQHNPEVIGLLLKMMHRSAPPNVVIGSYFHRGSLGRRVAWRFLRSLGGIPVIDLTSGYRVYDYAAMRVAASKAATLLEYQDVGVLLLFMKHGLSMVEVTTPMQPRSDGKSRIFRSWGRVLYYLVSASLLCASKTRKGTLATTDKVTL